MKSFLISTALAATLALPVAAADLFIASPVPQSITASKFIGMRVYASDKSVDATGSKGAQTGWSDIGEIHDVVLTRNGTVSSVLVDVGGFLGIGEHQVALSMGEVKFVSDSSTDNPDDFFLVVNADRAMIEKAPSYAMPQALTTGAADPAATTAPAAADTMAATGTKTMPATTGSTAMVEDYAAADIGTLTAKDLIGARVYGPENADLGEVSNVDLGTDGKVTALTVDVGGFLGIGEKPVSVAIDQAQILKEVKGTAIRVYVPMTNDQLKQMPAVPKS